MALRSHEITDALGKLDKRFYPCALTSISLELSPEKEKLRFLRLAIPPGFGVIAGGNGAGKSTLLRGLQALDRDQEASLPARFIRALIRGTNHGSAWEVELINTPKEGGFQLNNLHGEPPQLIFIDPAAEAQDAYVAFASDPNYLDLLAGADPHPLEPIWVAHASRVLKRTYSSIEVTETEGDGIGGITPWFQVSAKGTKYTTLEMGRGELSALYMIWRLSQVPKNCIVVIDEPESGLAASSQEKLKDTFAFISANDGVSFLISTHSPGLLLGLPGTPVSIIETIPELASYGPMDSASAAHRLGAPTDIRLALFAEDQMASELARSLLRHIDPALSARVEVFPSRSGESSLERLSSDFISNDQRRRQLNLMVALDGDQRILNNGKRSPRDSRLYLPGNKAPEEVLRESLDRVLTADEQPALASFGIPDPETFLILNTGLSGEDHHDWFAEMAKHFQTYSATCDTLVRICMEDPDFLADAKDFVETVRSKIND